MDKTPELPADGQFTRTIMQANFSAILYLLTEQQALIGQLLQALLESQVIDSRQLSEITDLTGGEDGLIPTYTVLYNRFATYYLRTKAVLEQGEALAKATEEAMKKDEDEAPEDPEKGDKDE